MSNSWPKWISAILLTIATLIVVPVYGFYWYGASALPRDIAPSSRHFSPELRALYWRSLEGNRDIEIREFNPFTFTLKFAVYAIRTTRADRVQIDAGQQALNFPARMRVSRTLPDLRGMRRHAAEIAYLIRISREWSDSEILDSALAEAWYGRNASGIDAAAEAYFDVPAEQLNTEESLALLTLLKGPSYYEPTCNRERFTKRYQRLAALIGIDGSAGGANLALSRLVDANCVKPVVIPAEAGIQRL